MKTRTIEYVDFNHDYLGEEVDLALNSTAEENLKRFCDVLAAQLAMQNIDLKSHLAQRVIYYIDEPDTK